MDRHRLRAQLRRADADGGKFADLLGRRRIFVVGIVVFTIASLFCGLADSGDELIAWRIVQEAAPP